MQWTDGKAGVCAVLLFLIFNLLSICHGLALLNNNFKKNIVKMICGFWVIFLTCLQFLGIISLNALHGSISVFSNKFM